MAHLLLKLWPNSGSTRSRQVELLLNNPDAVLLPGAYAEVTIPVTSSVESLVVPAATLIIRDQFQGLRWWTLTTKLIFARSNSGATLAAM